MPVTITESTSIDYDIHGEGPPLLLISGLGFGRWGWFKQVPAFSRHFQTITFDIRGERRLENGVHDLVRDGVSLLDHLGVKKAHVLGASLGGFVGQELALLRPDLVDRRVLDHAGHLVFIERFADVNREVVSFLGPRGSRKQVGARSKWARRQARALGWIMKVPRSLGRWSGRLWDSIF